MQAANEFLEKEYWPEWNTKFARPARGPEDLHRPLTEGLELGSALSHVERRIITNNYTFAYYSKNYQIVREDVQPGMKRQSLGVELSIRKLNGSSSFLVHPWPSTGPINKNTNELIKLIEEPQRCFHKN